MFTFREIIEMYMLADNQYTVDTLGSVLYDYPYTTDKGIQIC